MKPTKILRNINKQMKRLGWSTNRTATLLAVDQVCASRTASRYLSGKGDTVTVQAEAILDWLERQKGSIDTKEADSALKSCMRTRFQPGFGPEDNAKIG